MVMRRYETYLRVLKTIFYKLGQEARNCFEHEKINFTFPSCHVIFNVSKKNKRIFENFRGKKIRNLKN